MDGKARRVDSAILERWFRSLRAEHVRVSGHGTPAGLRRLIDACVEQCSNARPHQSLDYATPAEWYYSGLMAA